MAQLRPTRSHEGRIFLVFMMGLALIIVSLAGCSNPAGTAAAPALTSPPPQPSATPLPVSTSPSTLPAPTGTVTVAPTAKLPTETPMLNLATRTAAPGQVRLRLMPVAEGLDRPVFVTHAGDGSGRIFIIEKSGTIRTLAAGRLLARPFLDVRERVGSAGSEQGLLGLAFAPDYDRSGHFYINYTDRRGDTVVARYQVTADPDLADPASESVLLKIAQPAANHNGGMLAFGPDGLLWIGTGDGGGANDRYGNGQNPQTLLGKLLRLDVADSPNQPYVIPPDNPWVASDWNGRDVRGEVWAVGLRNPWRYSFDRDTGDLWIADVGQNRYEEINRVPAGSAGGLNFGWPIAEGSHCFPEEKTCDRSGLAGPLFDYPHQDGNCSITGGYVYRGTLIPALQGAYLFGDFCSGKIWALAETGSGWQSPEILDTTLSISSFGEDEIGELYAIDLNGGVVYRLVAG